MQVIRQFLHLLDERFNNKLFIKNRHIFLSSRVFFYRPPQYHMLTRCGI
nr:MAG TPA: hypothetical protein [Caudoviricetes sp.]